MSTIGSIETSSRPPLFSSPPVLACRETNPHLDEPSHHRAYRVTYVSVNVTVSKPFSQLVRQSRAIVSSSISSANISNKYLNLHLPYLLYLQLIMSS